MTEQRDTREREEADVRGAGDDADIRRIPAGELEGSEPTEGEIRIPIVEEELVVEKRPVVREVLVIRKRIVTETREVEADLRKEKIVVERDLPEPRSTGDSEGRATGGDGQG